MSCHVGHVTGVLQECYEEVTDLNVSSALPACYRILQGTKGSYKKTVPLELSLKRTVTCDSVFHI